MLRNISYILVYFLWIILSPLQAENIKDPCQLLTQQEIEKIMNIPMKAGQLKDHRSYFLGLGCWYRSVQQFEKSGSVNITIDTTQNMKETDSIYTSAKDHYDRQKYAYIKALKGRNEENRFHKIEGLGDDAYWNHVSLIILNKDSYINIRVHASAGMSANSSEELQKKIDVRTLSVSKEIAQLVLKRLETK